MIDRWTNYFEEQLNRQISDERETQFNNDECDFNEENCEPPTIDEMRDVQ